MTLILIMMNNVIIIFIQFVKKKKIYNRNIIDVKCFVFTLLNDL